MENVIIYTEKTAKFKLNIKSYIKFTSEGGFSRTTHIVKDKKTGKIKIAKYGKTSRKIFNGKKFKRKYRRKT